MPPGSGDPSSVETVPDMKMGRGAGATCVWYCCEGFMVGPGSEPLPPLGFPVPAPVEPPEGLDGAVAPPPPPAPPPDAPPPLAPPPLCAHAQLNPIAAASMRCRVIFMESLPGEQLRRPPI